MLGPEEWRPVPSQPEILASSWGRIRRVERVVSMPYGGTRVYSPQPTYGNIAKVSKRYARLVVHYRGIGTVKVARMVCEAFHGPEPFKGADAMHDDEDAFNNVPGNLSWGTRKENLNAPGFVEYCRARVMPA